MFGFLKEKLKKALGSFEKKVEYLPEEKRLIEETKAPEKELPKEEPAKAEEKKEEYIQPAKKEENIAEIILEAEKEEYKEKKPAEKERGFFGKIKDRFKKEEIKEVKKEEAKKEPVEIKEPEEKKGFFEKIKEIAATKKISDKDFDDAFYDLEIALIESNVAYAVVEKIKEDLRKSIVDKPIKRNEVDSIIERTLKESIESLFTAESFNLIEKIKEKKEKPFIIAFVGVNGVGKTSTIAKMAYNLKKNGLSCILAASDTWRAASIEQLEHHADKIGVKIIKHNYGSDPTAVAFDAVKFAKSKNMDIVLIDTAGRQHSNANLISEMQKIMRVIKPDLKLFVGESITGSDCIEQASKFDEAIGIDGIILSKVDVDEKGGAAISIEYVVKKPIIYIGTGQGYEDLQDFDKNKMMASIGI